MIPFQAISWGVLTLVTWGAADFLARSAAERVGSASTAFFVLAVGTVAPVVLLLAEAGLGSGLGDIDWATAAWLAPVVGGVAGAAYVVYYTGFERGSVSIVSAVASAWVVVSVLVAALLLGEAIGWKQALSILVVATGVVTIGLHRGTGAAGSSGVAWGVGAMVLLGVALALWKPLTDAVGPALSVIFVRLLAAGVVLGYLCTRRAVPSARSLLPTRGVLLAAALLDGMGFVFYNVGLERTSVVLMAPLAAAHPLATVALAVAVLRERPAKQQILGGVVTLAGVVALSAVTGG